MIENVSDELLTKWLDIGIQIGMTVAPVDAAGLEPIMGPVYQRILEQDPPKEYVLCPSPAAAWDELARREYPQAPHELEFVWPDLDGHWFAHYYEWVGLYKELGVKIPEIYDVYEKMKILDIIYPMPDYCVVSDCPRHIRTIPQGDLQVLHYEDGMAIEYADGFGVYALHGVRVPATVVTTKPEELTKKWIQENFLQQPNVDICREIIRKFKIEKIYDFLDAEVLDTVVMYIDSDQVLYPSAASLPEGKEVRPLPYELVMLQLSTEIRHPYLRMENASLPGVFHLEAVGRDCRTVREALAFRNGTDELPSSLS